MYTCDICNEKEYSTLTGLNGHKFHCFLKSKGLKYTDVLSPESHARIKAGSVAASNLRKESRVLKPVQLCYRIGCINPAKVKYCSRSCAALVNNSNRVHSDGTKEKIRQALYRGRLCRDCGISIKTSRKLCDMCFKKFKEEFSPKPRIKLVSEKVCKACKTKFETVGKNQRNRVTCGDRKCKNLCCKWTPERRQKLSDSKKVAYALGVIKVHGGKTKWYTYKGIRVQGSYELRVCAILDRWVSDGKIVNWEYTNDRFEYIGTDGKHNPDFKVFEQDCERYIEVKGFMKENDKLKWEAARKLVKLDVWFGDRIKQEES